MEDMDDGPPQLGRDAALEEHYMRQALEVAGAALEVGEVPVGCVIVLGEGGQSISEGGGGGDGGGGGGLIVGGGCSGGEPTGGRKGEGDPLPPGGGGGGDLPPSPLDHPSVVISHGANQVNATRDATRHAELVALDRMLTGGMASDRLRMGPRVVAAAGGRGELKRPLRDAEEGEGGGGGGGGEGEEEEEEEEEEGPPQPQSLPLPLPLRRPRSTAGTRAERTFRPIRFTGRTVTAGGAVGFTIPRCWPGATCTLPWSPASCARRHFPELASAGCSTAVAIPSSAAAALSLTCTAA